MSFLAPWWLLLFVPVALLAVAYVLQHRRRSRYAVRFASLPMLERLVPRRPGWRRHLPAALLLLAFAALALAVARPEADVRVPRKNATVIVAIDVSISMRATDVPPSRVAAAAAAARRFVEGLPGGIKAGLVTFSGRTAVRAAPTTDRQEVDAALQSLTLSTRTAIGEGVFTSLDEIRSTALQAGEKRVPATVVLLSDGTNTTGRTPAEAAVASRAAGVPVSTIAYGTPQGTVELEGQVIAVPVDKLTLATLARDTGGHAYTAQTSEELNHVYDDIRSTIGFRSETREITQYFAGLALVLGLVAAALSLRWFSRLP
ncbi:MAG: VWA domain-containing protein [Marmoricola sp.]